MTELLQSSFKSGQKSGHQRSSKVNLLPFSIFFFSTNRRITWKPEEFRLSPSVHLCEPWFLSYQGVIFTAPSAARSTADPSAARVNMIYIQITQWYTKASITHTLSMTSIMIQRGRERHDGINIGPYPCTKFERNRPSRS